MEVLGELRPDDLEVHPLAQAETIPAAWYTDPRFHDLDHDHLLPESWQYVGHESQLQNSGDFIVDEILGRPIIVVRNRRGELRAFDNVCRHRGGPLATENGNARLLTCMYHAWSYDLDGQLVGVPRFEGVENFDKGSCRLPEVRLGTYEGMVFVDISGRAGSIEDVYGGIREAIQPISLSEMRYVRRVVYDINCNWKVYIDNYLEGYHIRPIHPELAHILDVSGYTTTTEGERVLQYGPLAGSDNPYHTSGAAYYYYMFPNVMLNILPGRCQVNSIIPLAPDRTRTVFDFYYKETDPKKLEALMHDDHEISDLIQKQDIWICEQVQKGLKSGSYSKGRFSVQEEAGVHAFQALLKQAYSCLRGKAGRT